MNHKKNTKEKIQLHGFNNLTKTLSFNIYDVCYAVSHSQIEKHMQYIDEAYNAERLTNILQQVADTIGAKILNIVNADYEPLGASVTMLVAEDAVVAPNMTAKKQSIVEHLDKSHLTVHTYPENHPIFGISTFRADIDVSTCGKISPLKALNFLIKNFESDIVIIDYRVRGFTRDKSGEKVFIDHPINSIQNFISSEIKSKYQMVDVNIYQENVFHTKMMLFDFNIDDYLFELRSQDLNPEQRKLIEDRLRKEMIEIFYGRNTNDQQSIFSK